MFAMQRQLGLALCINRGSRQDAEFVRYVSHVITHYVLDHTINFNKLFISHCVG